MYTIIPYAYALDDDRFIITDSNGFDVFGEHFSFEEAKQELNNLVTSNN